MKPRIQSILLPALAAGFAITSAHADPLAAGDKIGIDFGSATTAANWNNFTALGLIGAGSVTNLAGTTVDGVSVAVASTVGTFWGAGTNNWAGLSTNGGSAPVEFVNEVTSDFGGYSAAGGSMTITLTGLNTALNYNIYGVTMTNVATNRQDRLTVTGDVTYGPSTILRSTSVGGAFHTFTDVSPNGSGTITITLTEPAYNNGIINGLLIKAVEPPRPLGVRRRRTLEHPGQLVFELGAQRRSGGGDPRLRRRQHHRPGHRHAGCPGHPRHPHLQPFLPLHRGGDPCPDFRQRRQQRGRDRAIGRSRDLGTGYPGR